MQHVPLRVWWKKKRPGPTFHLGHTSCVCDGVCTMLFYPFIYELSHAASYEDGVKSHQLGFGEGVCIGIPRFSCSSFLLKKIKTILSRGLAVKTRMKTLPHEAVVIN